MPYCKAWEERRAAGLCMRCGGPREGEGATPRFCPACADRNRTDLRARYATHILEVQRDRAECRKRRRDGGLCTKCGRARSDADCLAGRRICESCRQRNRGYDNEANRRKRVGTFYGCDDGMALPLGGAVPLGSVATLELRLDYVAQVALRTLLQNYWHEEWKAAREEDRTPRLFFQMSRIVREAIRYHDRTCDIPHRPPHRDPDIEQVRVAVRVDAGTLNIVDRHAWLRSRTRAETVCDLLISAAWDSCRARMARENEEQFSWRSDDGDAPPSP